MTIEFHCSVFADTFEEQANAQGFTFGDMADWIEEVGKGLTCLWIHGCMTDKEYDRILQKFQKKILLKNLKKLETKEKKKGVCEYDIRDRKQ